MELPLPIVNRDNSECAIPGNIFNKQKLAAFFSKQPKLADVNTHCHKLKIYVVLIDNN